MKKKTKETVDLENTSISKYWHDIENNKIVVCNKIRYLYKHLYKKLYDTENKYHFDFNRSQRPITFIEKFCKHSRGKLG